MVFTDYQTFTYKVTELTGKSLSHLTIALPICLTNEVLIETDGKIGYDPTTEVLGIKWDLPESFTEGTFSFTLDKKYEMGFIRVYFKAGDGYEYVDIEGPNCAEEMLATPTPTVTNTATATETPTFTPTRPTVTASSTPTEQVTVLPPETPTEVATATPTATSTTHPTNLELTPEPGLKRYYRYLPVVKNQFDNTQNR